MTAIRISDQFFKRLSFVHQRKAAVSNNIEWFNHNSIDTSFRCQLGINCLHLASSRGHMDIVSKLTPNAYDVDVKTDNNETALMFACSSGEKDVASKLIALGADLNAFNKSHHHTPLILACKRGHTDIAVELIAKGADVNMQDVNGLTSLIYASSYGYTNIVLDLLSNGANPNIRCKTSSSALTYAVLHTHIEIVKILLSYGAAPDLHDKWNENVLDCIAYEKGHSQIEKIINTWKQTPRSLKFYVTRNIVSKVNSLLLKPNAFEKEIN